MLNPYYIVGFVDGEGSFYLRHYTTRKNYYVPEFQIQLRKDDIHILEEIQAFFGCGKIKEHKTKLHGNAKGNVLFTVTKKEDLKNIIVPFFDKYQLQAKKKIDYVLWRQSVMLWNDDKWKDIENRKLLAKLHEVLNIYRPGLVKGDNMQPTIIKNTNEKLNIPNYVVTGFEGEHFIAHDINGNQQLIHWHNIGFYKPVKVL